MVFVVFSSCIEEEEVAAAADVEGKWKLARRKLFHVENAHQQDEIDYLYSLTRENVHNLFCATTRWGWKVENFVKKKWRQGENR